MRYLFSFLATLLLASTSLAHTDEIGTLFLVYCAQLDPNGRFDFDKCKRNFISEYDAACGDIAAALDSGRLESYTACTAERASLCPTEIPKSRSWDICLIRILSDRKTGGACRDGARPHTLAIHCSLARDLKNGK